MASTHALGLAALAIAAAGAAGLGGCGKRGAGAPSCEQAVAAASRRIGGDPARGVAMCERQHWSDDVRRCVSRATAAREVLACAGGAAPPPPSSGPPRRRAADDEADTVRRRLQHLAREAYPMWAAHHPGTPCPRSLADLADLLDSRPMRDAWGHDLVMRCGDAAPPEARGFGVVSLGPDGRQGTADDLHSW